MRLSRSTTVLLILSHSLILRFFVEGKMGWKEETEEEVEREQGTREINEDHITHFLFQHAIHSSFLACFASNSETLARQLARELVDESTQKKYTKMKSEFGLLSWG